MRFAYCGYDFFHECLSLLVESGHELTELFTWPTDNEYDFNTNVMKLAQRSKARITLSPISQYDLERLRQKGTELIISAAYPYKIPDWRGLLAYGVNIHPSYLPTGRGPWPLPWVILKNLNSTGVTIHELSSGWDAGHIVLQDKIAVSHRETLEISFVAIADARQKTRVRIHGRYRQGLERPQTARRKRVLADAGQKRSNDLVGNGRRGDRPNLQGVLEVRGVRFHRRGATFRPEG
jgi:methionyl-tRNA formyltransferase